MRELPGRSIIEVYYYLLNSIIIQLRCRRDIFVRYQEIIIRNLL